MQDWEAINQDVGAWDGNDADAVLAGAGDFLQQGDGVGVGPQDWQDLDQVGAGGGVPADDNDQWAPNFDDYGGHFAALPRGRRGGYGANHRGGRYA